MIQFNVEKLQILMNEFELKKTDVARRTGYTMSYISMVMQGERDFTDNLQRKLNLMFQELTDVKKFVERNEKAFSKLV
ncbi:hypothetical protein [Thalassobacillus sp. CUG 92003]|uniref:hypothetical protein n=1 Tax=Thalassobacillus sp. CUG 92003 TaxID=2736641 RepID=UPI0015E7AF79|nr:hypothetical protein [Thalassobacillus sp. CUG 92003]